MLVLGAGCALLVAPTDTNMMHKTDVMNLNFDSIRKPDIRNQQQKKTNKNEKNFVQHFDQDIFQVPASS